MREREDGRRTVVVTGWGAVTPVGLTADETWEAMRAGRSGIRTIDAFDTSDLPTSIGGQVRGFDPDAYVPRKVSRRMDTYAQYAVGAAVQAVEAAKLSVDERMAPRVGVLVGSGYGPVTSNHDLFATMRDRGPRPVSPFAPVRCAMDSASGEISMLFRAKGPSRVLSTACASGADAIGSALDWIRSGRVDVVVTGGAESCLTRGDIAGSGNARALSTRVDEPERACRPFDEDRDGFVMSEGAGILVLEAADHARRRGAEVLAEVAGYDATSDAHHWTAPEPGGAGAVAAMRNALADAGVEPSEVDHVNAHGTSTPLNDRIETDAVKAVLGTHATTIPVSSTKSVTGHMIGAAGAVELIAAGYAVRTGVVPPTVNCDRPIDPAMNYVPHTAQQRDVRVVMSNSFGFGGHNAVLVLRRWED